MPYIPPEHREEFADGLRLLPRPETAGELNFLLTMVCRKYLERQHISYAHYNDILGALEGCKLEFYARSIRPYEDEAIARNGDL